MFWNRTLLKWEEPRFAQKYIAKNLRVRDYLSAFGKTALKLALGTYIVFWFLRWLSPRKTTSFFDLELFGVVLLIVGLYFFTWLIMLIGSKFSKPQVSLREKGITYISVEGNGSLSYKKMESFSLLKANLDAAEFYVLGIKNWDGGEFFIEIDPEINKDRVAEILKSKSVRMTAPLLNPV